MDFVFGNETEARTFSKVHGWEVNNFLVDLQVIVLVFNFYLSSILIIFLLTRLIMLRRLP